MNSGLDQASEKRFGDDVPIPEILYKFRPMLTEQDRRFTREIIVDSKLFFPTALQFNDPFEASPAIEVDTRPEVLKRHLRDIVSRQMPEASRAQRRDRVAAMLRKPKSSIIHWAEAASRTTLADIGLCSLAGNNTSILMWSHYAASHSGICLGFRTQPFDRRSAVCRAYAVRYEENRPLQDPLSGMDPYDLFNLLLTKASFWEYEEEYRLVRESPSDGAGHEPFAPNRLVSITFGLRTPPEVVETIKGWIRERRREVSLYQAQVDPKRFSLTVEPWPNHSEVARPDDGDA